MKIEKISLYPIAMLLVCFTLGLATVGNTATDGDNTSAAEVKQETEKLLKDLKSYTVEQRDQAVRETRQALAKLDRRIDALESRIDKNWDKMDRATRESARASLKALHRQRTEVAEWYGSMKSSSGEAWGHMKKGFSDAYGSLQNAWEKSEKEFESNK